MIALDTNVLLRLVAADDAGQVERVRRLVDYAAATAEPLFVSDVVLCEFAWVLTRAYRARRPDLESTLRAPLGATHLAFESAERVGRALDAFSGGKGDFSDYLVREHARASGCEYVTTFDGALLREDGFRAP